MKLKWTEKDLEYFSKPVKTAERISELFWWLIIAVSLSTVIWMGIKLYQLYLVQTYISNF